MILESTRKKIPESLQQVGARGVYDARQNGTKKLWRQGRYRDRINQMLDKFGTETLGYEPELHTPLVLTEKRYVELLAIYQDVSVCSFCGRRNRKINIHHVDGCHDNFLISNLEPLCVPCHASYHYGDRKQPFMTIGRLFSFASAHRLKNHPGKCKNLHGHEWQLEVYIKKRIHPDTGMVMDFGDLKYVVNKYVIDILDHSYLNDIVSLPTAENLLLWIWEQLMLKGLLKGIERIRLWESTNSPAELTVEGMLSVFTVNIEDYVPVKWKK